MKLLGQKNRKNPSYILFPPPRITQIFYFVIGSIIERMTPIKGNQMNKDQVEGKSRELLSKIKQAYHKMTDDDLALYDDKRDEFYAKLQQTHGIAREAAEEQIKRMEKSTYKSDAAHSHAA